MNRKNDLYYDDVYYHRARKIHSDGGVTALCYKSDRKIRLNGGWSWTIINHCVTCPRCLAILADMGIDCSDKHTSVKERK